MALPRTISPRRSVLLTLECDNDCVFCGQNGLSERSESPFALRGVGAIPANTLPPLAESDFPELTFIGGEPTLLADLPHRIEEAKAAGYRSIGLQTHGRHLADASLLERLAAAGLTDLHFSLHGPDSATHDYHAGVPGAFEQIRKASSLARSCGLTAVVSTVLTRSNYAVLSQMPQLLKKWGVAAWVVTLPRAAGAAERDFDQVMPRIGLAMPYLLHALSLAGRISLPAFVRGAPLCTLGPFTSRSLQEPEQRAFHEPTCGGCPAREQCPGVDPLYLHRFNGDELTPHSHGVEPLQPRSEREAELLRMFVGTGPVVSGTLSTENVLLDAPATADGSS